jgi:hypothetical protein
MLCQMAGPTRDCSIVRVLCITLVVSAIAASPGRGQDMEPSGVSDPLSDINSVLAPMGTASPRDTTRRTHQLSNAVAVTNGAKASRKVRTVSIHYPHEASLRTIFREIGSQARVSFVWDRSIPDTSMVVTIKSAEPLDAIYALAALNGLRVVESRKRRGRPAFRISKESGFQKAICCGYTRSRMLRGLRAVEFATQLRTRFPSVQIEADSWSNVLILRAQDCNRLDEVDLAIRIAESNCVVWESASGHHTDGAHRSLGQHCAATAIQND